MLSVKVISKSSGKPASGKKVSVVFSGLLRGMATEYTDSSGEAHFNVDPGTGIIYVSGSKVYEGYISGMKVVYI